MDLGLKDKVALVTGAASQIGIGKAVVLTLAKEGCDIIVGDIDLEGAEKTVAEVKALGRKAIAFKADITSSAEVGEMVKSALAQFGKIDILVNNAGAAIGAGPFAESNEADWDKCINLNFKGVLECSRAVINHMISRKSGKIVNISSIGGRIGSGVYGAAKAAVINFTIGLAREVGPFGINVNGVAPGMLQTNFAGGKLPPDLTAEKVAEGTTLKKITTTQDIANAVVFLASDMSSDITGQNLSVDGGEFMV